MRNDSKPICIVIRVRFGMIDWVLKLEVFDQSCDEDEECVLSQRLSHANPPSNSIWYKSFLLQNFQSHLSVL